MTMMHSVEMATPPVITQRNVSSDITARDSESAFLRLQCQGRAAPDSRGLARAVWLHFFAICLFAGRNRVAQRILLAINHITAFLDHGAGGIPELRSLFLQIF